jgi:hypothetical protein
LRLGIWKDSEAEKGGDDEEVADDLVMNDGMLEIGDGVGEEGKAWVISLIEGKGSIRVW